MAKALNLTGKKIGRLTVMHFERMQGDKRMWRCQCECGGTSLVCTSALSGKVYSCGCYRKEVSSRLLTERNLRRAGKRKRKRGTKQ